MEDIEKKSVEYSQQDLSSLWQLQEGVSFGSSFAYKTVVALTQFMEGQTGNFLNFGIHATYVIL